MTHIPNQDKIAYREKQLCEAGSWFEHNLKFNGTGYVRLRENQVSRKILSTIRYRVLYRFLTLSCQAYYRP